MRANTILGGGGGAPFGEDPTPTPPMFYTLPNCSFTLETLEAGSFQGHACQRRHRLVSCFNFFQDTASLPQLADEFVNYLARHNHVLMKAYFVRAASYCSCTLTLYCSQDVLHEN